MCCLHPSCAAGRYTGVGGMIGKLFAQKEKVIESDDNKNKPWILW